MARKTSYSQLKKFLDSHRHHLDGIIDPWDVAKKIGAVLKAAGPGILSASPEMIGEWLESETDYSSNKRILIVGALSVIMTALANMSDEDAKKADTDKLVDAAKVKAEEVVAEVVTGMRPMPEWLRNMQTASVLPLAWLYEKIGAPIKLLDVEPPPTDVAPEDIIVGTVEDILTRYGMSHPPSIHSFGANPTLESIRALIKRVAKEDAEKTDDDTEDTEDSADEAPVAHAPLAGLVHWHDQVSADAYAAVYARAEGEAKPFQDLNEGFEGEAGHIVKAMGWFLEHDPAGAEKLFAGARGQEVLDVIEWGKSLPASARGGMLRVWLERELAKILIEYNKSHEDKLAEAKDWIDMVSPFVPEEVRKDGSRKKVTDWVKKTGETIANLLLRYAFGGTVALLVILVLLAFFLPTWMMPVNCLVFIVTLVVAAGYAAGIGGGGLIARSAVALSLILYGAGVFAITLAASTLFATDPRWFWTGFSLSLANVVVWDVLALRLVDDVWDAIRLSGTGIAILIKDLVPGGETGAEYAARVAAYRAEHGKEKTVRFKRIIFNIGLILSFVLALVGLGGLMGLETLYIRWSLVPAMFILAGSYAYSRLLVGDSAKGIPHDLEEHVKTHRQHNLGLAYFLIKRGAVPVLLCMLVAVMLDPFRLSGVPDEAAKVNSITWHIRGFLGTDAADKGSQRQGRIVQATATVTGANLNWAKRKADASKDRETACLNVETFLRDNPTYCTDPVMVDTVICTDATRCGIDHLEPASVRR